MGLFPGNCPGMDQGNDSIFLAGHVSGQTTDKQPAAGSLQADKKDPDPWNTIEGSMPWQELMGTLLGS